jgi:O-antigen/teichoic acid export membrane protein
MDTGTAHREIKENSSLGGGTKRRLVLGFLSNFFGKLSASIIQLVQVPVFLHFWSVPLYGEWLIVTAIPVYLSFSNIGFGNVAGNEMSMLSGAGDRDGALRVFQSCWWLISIICTATIAVLSGALYLLPVSHLLKLSAIGSTDTKWIVFYLGVSVLLGQLEQLLQSAYRCIGRYPYGSFLESTMSLAAFACTILTVSLGAGARTTALVFGLANLAGTLALALFVRRDIPWIHFGWDRASLAQIWKLTGPAIAFMGFPIGNALNIQGTLMAVGYALGPTDVVIFGTARTVSRFALQMVQMVNTTFWPEMSIAFGSGNTALTRTLHRRACQMALLIALVVVAGMMTVGPWFLSHWTGGRIPPSRGLLSILLVVVVFYALWSTSSTLMAAINQHQKLAAWYIFATSLTCALCFVLSRRYGLYGAAISLLASELIMNLYVLPASLHIAHDTLPAFLASMLQYPASLNWKAMAGRLRRSKPSLES